VQVLHALLKQASLDRFVVALWLLHSSHHELIGQLERTRKHKPKKPISIWIGPQNLLSGYRLKNLKTQPFLSLHVAQTSADVRILTIPAWLNSRII
jgi:hypothetical protein